MSMTLETERVYVFGNIPWDGTFAAACIAGLCQGPAGAKRPMGFRLGIEAQPQGIEAL